MSFLVIAVDPWCFDRKTSGVGWIVPHHPLQSGYHPENEHSNHTGYWFDQGQIKQQKSLPCQRNITWSPGAHLTQLGWVSVWSNWNLLLVRWLSVMVGMLIFRMISRLWWIVRYNPFCVKCSFVEFKTVHPTHQPTQERYFQFSQEAEIWYPS